MSYFLEALHWYAVLGVVIAILLVLPAAIMGEFTPFDEFELFTLLLLLVVTALLWPWALYCVFTEQLETHSDHSS